MKYKSLIFSIILVSVTLLASWTVPATGTENDRRFAQLSADVL